ncbi:MAG: hypothetical protein IKU69_04160 [Roseburia sp.]|nr:hypothetical protein [Roseburia sp.]
MKEGEETNLSRKAWNDKITRGVYAFIEKEFLEGCTKKWLVRIIRRG